MNADVSRGVAVVIALCVAVGAVATCASRPPGRDPSTTGPRRTVRVPAGGCPAFATRADVPTFHGDRRRSGWQRAEPALSPGAVASPAFGALWTSPRFDEETVGGRSYAPHMYATPLYLDGVRVMGGAFAGATMGLVFAATSNGWMYAVNAFDNACGGPPVAAGTIVWRTRLAPPAVVPRLDGGVPLGVLSTPVIDASADPPRIYVTAIDADAGWRAYALDVRDGSVLPGWPVDLNDASLTAVNGNGPARFNPAVEMSQRAALNLSPGGDTLYVAFASFPWTATGWMVAVDTRAPRVARAFSSAPAGEGNGRGGIWGSGGPAVDDDGALYATTGNGIERSGDLPGHWASSLLRWTPALDLAATYTPFNYCTLDDRDMDLGSSQPIVFDLAPGESSTPHLVAFGGKQGTVYLVDRDRMPGRLDRRPRCDSSAAGDGSLLPPGPQPQFMARGPLQVFDPYTDREAMLDHARMHTTPALFRDDAGRTYLFVSGAAKGGDHDPRSVPPGIVRLRVASTPGAPAYLEIDGAEQTTTLVNPGSPVVTSNGGRDAVVWVLDSNQPRTAHLSDARAAHPVLYAFDAMTLRLLWRTPDDWLFVGGKYSSPMAAHGTVFVGTDRIEAFGTE